MLTKRDSALINSGDDHKRQKMNNDASVKHKTTMEDLVRNIMLPSIVLYLSPHDILNCIQTSKEWEEEIDTDYVWKDMLLPSLMSHIPPSDISTCIRASSKWKNKIINTVDNFWKQVVNTTAPPIIVDIINFSFQQTCVPI